MIDPITILMFALIGVLIFFMFRNGRKRQQAMQEMQNGLRPGAEVMLQSGIFATVEELDEEDNRLTVRSGTSTLVVHRNAVGQIVTPVTTDANDEETSSIAPDDDPAFGERLAESRDADSSDDSAASTADASEEAKNESDESDSSKN